MAKGKESQKLIANNKKAYHDFFIDETYECGIASVSYTHLDVYKRQIPH